MNRALLRRPTIMLAGSIAATASGQPAEKPLAQFTHVEAINSNSSPFLWLELVACKDAYYDGRFTPCRDACLAVR
jgi:hypothetical protein